MDKIMISNADRRHIENKYHKAEKELNDGVKNEGELAGKRKR